MVLRKNNLEIPARFSFRPRVAKWQATWAELVDWAEESSGSLTLLAPFAPPIEKARRKTGDRVIVRVALPLDIGNQLNVGLTDGLQGIYGEALSDVDIEMPRNELPTGLLDPNETPTTAQDIAGREFAMLISQLPKVLKPLEFHSSKSASERENERNAWVMLDSFFSLEQSVVALKKFLNSWGMWNSERVYQRNESFLRPYQPYALVVPDAIWRQREMYRKALSGSGRSWLRAARPLTFSTLEEWPHFLVERFTCQDAIEATITIEHLRGAKYGFCKRCRKMFERDTLHKKNYCSRKCIQADATARWRANQRKEAKKQGGQRNAKG